MANVSVFPNRIWGKAIPRVNGVFFVLYLLLLGLDLFLAMGLGLMELWYIMIGIFTAFLVFAYLESRVFRKFLGNSQSSFDRPIYLLVLIRNLLILLNFVPMLHLLIWFTVFGENPTMGILGIVALLLIYIGLIFLAFNRRISAVVH